MEVQLQRKDDQIQQQEKELQEQQRELQTLRVRKWTFSAIYMYEDIMITPVHILWLLGRQRKTAGRGGWSNSATRHRTSREDSSTQQATERTTNTESKEMNILLCGEVVTACSGCLGGQRKAADRGGG